MKGIFKQWYSGFKRDLLSMLIYLLPRNTALIHFEVFPKETGVATRTSVNLKTDIIYVAELFRNGGEFIDLVEKKERECFRPGRPIVEQ